MKNNWSPLILLWYALLLTALSSCADDDSVISPEKLSASYLPLEVGNYWEFKWTGASPNSSGIHREVIGTAELDGREYYLLTSRGALSQEWIDSVYYRVEPNGDVYTLRKGALVEELRYKLFANNGDSWSYSVADDDVMRVDLYIGSVQTQLKTVDDCKNYSFDVEKWVDEEHTNALAPGVGFIKEYSDAWGAGMILTKASIGGSVIEF